MPVCRGLLAIGTVVLPLVRVPATLLALEEPTLFELPLPFFRAVVAVDLGVVAAVLPDPFKPIGLRNLSSGLVERLEDSVVVCRGAVTVSPASMSSV